MISTTADLILPAPLWRRLAAAIYDGLLLLGVWMGTTLVYVPIRDALGARTENSLLPLFLFLAGLIFFGWSWTHGGQTPGMLAWNLRVRRDDGGTLRWPIAATRYAVLLGSWSVTLLPCLIFLPDRLRLLIPDAWVVAGCSLLLSLAALLVTQRDGRRRAPCDRLTGTEVVTLPRRPKSAPIETADDR